MEITKPNTTVSFNQRPFFQEDRDINFNKRSKAEGTKFNKNPIDLICGPSSKTVEGSKKRNLKIFATESKCL